MPEHSSAAAKQRILLIASLVSSLVMLDSNIVAVALPTISRSLGASFADMQWVITAYVLPFAALLLAAGSFGDRIGRRRAALLGLAIFAIASLFCGIATTPLMLNLARAAQGVGAALLLTCALAIINHSFRGAERAKAYAFWGAALGIAITCGPIVGGVISSAFGWHWAFLINLPICIALIAATLRFVPESRDPEATRFDFAGVITFSSGLFLLTWGVIDGNALGWSSSIVLSRFAGGIALLGAFVFAERLQQRPMVDFSLLGSRTFAGTAAAMVGYAAGAQVMIFYLPLYLQNAYGYAPVVAGLAMLPFALPMFLVPRLAARVATRYSSRTLLCLGLTISAVANVALALMSSARLPYEAFAIAMGVAGTGAGLLNGETAKALQGSLPAQRSGMASGIGATVRFSALLLGVAALGATLSSVTSLRFLQHADRWQLAPDTALTIAKRFAAGNGSGANDLLPEGVRAAAGDALRAAFDGGFAAAAWTAAGVALVTMLLTRSLMTAHRARIDTAAVAVPGE